MRILCVEDDPTIQLVYKRALAKNAGPQDEIIVVCTGEEGLDILAHQHIDILVLDLMLPGMPGLDVLRRARELRASLEVIVATGYATVDSAVEAMKLGARDYLTKPVNVSVLLEKISTIRDLLSRAAEADDLRYANQLMEENAHTTIMSLECALDTMRKIRGEVTAILEEKLDDSEKVNRMRMLLKNIGE